MARGKGTPSYLLLATDDARRADWKHRLRRHGAVRACASADAAKAELESSRPWLGFVVDVPRDTKAMHRLLRSMRRASPNTLGLLVTIEPAGDPSAVESAGFRHIDQEASITEVRAFLGHGLALEVTQDDNIAQAVEQLGRDKNLTVKQMELTALAATSLDREALVQGLGVSHNTVKTRIRQLLRLHDEETMDSLGKTVLRLALGIATGQAWNPSGSRGAMPKERKAVPRPNPMSAKKKATRRKRRR